MNRIEFIKLCTSAVLSLGIPYQLFPMNLKPSVEKDIYGGWLGKSFKATGFFRIEKGERWWLVTPKGNAFLSFGVNHFHTGWWKESYNREAWMKLLNVNDMKEFNLALRSWFINTCQDYGFNTAGVHSDLAVLNSPKPQIPYMQPIHFVDISHWKPSITDENFTDVFSNGFYQHCNQLAKKMALPLKDDPYLLGYSMADCPLFTEEDCRERPDNIYGARRASRVGWPRRLRNLGNSSAGKRSYVSLMSKIYEGNIQKFNETYTTQFDSFEALEKAERWRLETDLSNSSETRDNVEFLKTCVDQYYKTAKAAIYRYDSNHLFFGDKINGNSDAVDTLLPVTTKHTDVLFYQMYGKYEVQRPSLDRWSKMVDIPIINGDSAYTHIKDNMPRPYGPIANSENQNAEWTFEFFNHAFGRPEFVGWHYCGLIDTPLKLVAKESERQHSGLFDGYGNPYSALKETLLKCSNELYKIGSY